MDVRRLHHEHKDLIHDVAYDFYGRRMATCSSDQVIKIWDQADDGSWKKTADFKVSLTWCLTLYLGTQTDLVQAHQGSIWRLSWAHPEFGQILAACSFDECVSVWEEGTPWM